MGTRSNPLKPTTDEIAEVRSRLDERNLSSADLNAYVVGAVDAALRLAAEAHTPGERNRWIRHARAYIAAGEQIWAEWRAEFDA